MEFQDVKWWGFEVQRRERVMEAEKVRVERQAGGWRTRRGCSMGQVTHGWRARWSGSAESGDYCGGYEVGDARVETGREQAGVDDDEGRRGRGKGAGRIGRGN